jgi:hypothetical protein
MYASAALTPASTKGETTGGEDSRCFITTVSRPLRIYRSCQLWPATAPQNTAKGTGEMLQNECTAEGAADRAHSFPQVPAIQNER